MNRNGLLKDHIGLYELGRRMQQVEGLMNKRWPMRTIYAALRLGRIPAVKAMRKWQVPETFQWIKGMDRP